jgi:hypothetical protein
VKDASHQSLVENLSDADKDALIARLWSDLQAERARSTRLEERLVEIGTGRADGNVDAGILAKLRGARASAARLGQETPRPRGAPGLGSGLLRSRIVLCAALLLALAFALDYAVGRYQHYRIDQKQAAIRELQHAAYEGLFVELADIASEPDGKSYRLTMRMTSIEPDRPI